MPRPREAGYGYIQCCRCHHTPYIITPTCYSHGGLCSGSMSVSSQHRGSERVRVPGERHGGVGVQGGKRLRRVVDDMHCAAFAVANMVTLMYLVLHYVGNAPWESRGCVAATTVGVVSRPLLIQSCFVRRGPSN